LAFFTYDYTNNDTREYFCIHMERIVLIYSTYWNLKDIRHSKFLSFASEKRGGS
jgi:hypothetical protein